MGKPNKRSTKREDQYIKTLVNETLEDLGNRIHFFRNIGLVLAQKDTDKEKLLLIDEVYQVALDEIFDALSNAGDLKAGNIACDGIAKAMLVRRGFIKKSKAFE